MIGAIMRDIFRRTDRVQPSMSTRRRVLNVGGYSKAIGIPAHYDGWEHLLLDVDPKSKADFICDARQLNRLEPQMFDAVYCSHNLEHYCAHDIQRVLTGFLHMAERRVASPRSMFQIFKH
jgi:predicted SAM-dependent methyltransferase